MAPDPEPRPPSGPAPGSGAGPAKAAAARRMSLLGSMLHRLAAGLALVTVGMVMLTGCGGDSPANSGDTIRFTIPSGTTRLLEQGGTSRAIAEKITARVGDTLVVENNDESTQFIAGYSVSPGQTLKIPLNRSGDYITNCSAHRDRSIRMVVSD